MNNISRNISDVKGGGDGEGVAFTNTKNALLRHESSAIPVCGIKPPDCRAAFVVSGPSGKRWRRCGRPGCSRGCRDQFAWKMWQSLRLSFLTLPPDFFCTLHPRSESVGSFAAALAKFFRTLLRAGIEWFRIFEWRHGRVHGHALLRGRVTRRVFRTASRSANIRATCKRVSTVVGVAAYIVKHTRRTDRKAELAPSNFRGRLFTSSRGFLVAPFRKLWNRIRAERAAKIGGAK